MPHIQTGNSQPGIVSLLFYKKSTGKALSTLAQTVLRGPSPLTSGEREMIAAYVSWLNQCEFCHQSHAASAVCQFTNGDSLIEAYRKDNNISGFSPRMQALLAIASQVQQSGRHVTDEAVAKAKAEGVTDEMLHDAVLVAAAFCMYNRYVDGLKTPLPEKHEEYADMGKRLSTSGYKYPNAIIRWIIRRMEKKKMQQASQG